LQRRGWEYRSLSRCDVDYTEFETLRKFLSETKPTFLVNAAGYTGKPNVDACETARADTLQGNTLFPVTLAHACAVANVPWGHVSSGCIYAGAWVTENGIRREEKDLTRPELRRLLEANPGALAGFVETDEPNFSFRRPPCSFYSGTKALAEEALAGADQAYVWRLRIPFDEMDNARNYLTKVQRYSKVYDNFNSLSHRGDFVKACLDLWERRAAFGTYNVTNPGFVTTRHVVQQIEKRLKLDRKFEFWASDEEFYKVAAKTPRSNCVMDVSKLLAAGVKMRPVEEALEHSLQNWVPEK
jgi:dTDP-4-dehydrorhamnose reductase